MKVNTMECSTTVERPISVLDKIRLPAEASLLREITQFVALINTSAPIKAGANTNIAFSLEQQVLSVSLAEMNHDLSKRIYAILARLNVINDEIIIKLMPAHDYNAFALHNSFNESLVLGLNSGILDAYSLDCTGFIIGHELGHHHLDHTRQEYKIAFQSIPEEHPLSRKALALSRCKEISADRFGLLCCEGNLETALIALRKTILQAVGKNLESIPQMESLYKFYDAELDGYQPWLHSHPHMSIRCKALIAWAPIAQCILTKQPISNVELCKINRYCEDLLTGMDHDDCKKKSLQDKYAHAIKVLELELVGQTKTAIFPVDHENTMPQFESSNYAEAVSYLKETASPGKRVRILDWMTSRAFMVSSSLEIRHELLGLAEEFGILATYKKRVTEMIARQNFITKQLN